MKTISLLTIIAAIACVSFTSIRAVTNSDIWLWLRVGKLISDTAQFPQKDILSHTAYGREWIVHGWGFGMLTFLTHKYLGKVGLAGLRLAISLLVFSTLKKTGKLHRTPETLLVLIISFCFCIISNAWMLRPHLLGTLYLGVLVLILNLYQTGKVAYAYTIPLLTLVWANTHASLPIAFIIIILFLGSEALEKLTRSEKLSATNSKPSAVKSFNFELLALIIPISFLTSLINPYHLKIYRYFFKINPLVKENILEWLPLAHFFDWSNAQVFLIFLTVTILTLIVSSIIKPQKISYFEIGLTILSAYLSLSALRHIVIASIILTPILAKSANVILRKMLPLDRRIERLLSLSFLVLIILITIKPAREVLAGRWGIRQDILSPEAINFIKEHPPEGNMYNHFNFGSTLMWHLYPQYKTFIDGRVDMFVPDIYQEWLIPATNKKGWEEILEKYEVGWIIFPTNAVWNELKESLEKENTWCLVFWDDSASIILKAATNESLCEGHAYQASLPLNPTSLQRAGKPEEAKAEYRRAIASSDQNASAHNKLGMIWASEGDSERAQKEFQKAINTNSLYAAAYLNLATLYEKQDPRKAIEVLETAIKKNPSAAGPYKKLASIYEKLGETEKALRYLRQYKK